MLPQFGDSDATLRSKRKNVLDYLTSNEFTPITKGHGIDLKDLRSTAAQA